MRTQLKACILGGTGFVGRELIHHLVAHGYECHLPTRRAHRHRDLRLRPGVRIHPVSALDSHRLEQQCADCDLVVNLIGILNPSARVSFQQVHVDLVERILAAAQSARVPRLLHLSALHAGESMRPEQEGSRYLASKGAGEARVLADSSLQPTVFRPSVIFGRGDRLFNRLAGLIDWAPGILPLACAGARFAPVWVGDVAKAMVQALERPESIGRSYDLCGPRVVSLNELVAYTANLRKRRIRIIELSDQAARMQARLFERVPGQPFTTDQYLSLQIDSVCGEHNGLLELGIHPTDIEEEMPRYLAAH